MTTGVMALHRGTTDTRLSIWATGLLSMIMTIEVGHLLLDILISMTRDIIGDHHLKAIINHQDRWLLNNTDMSVHLGKIFHRQCL